jgi:hypothetical protein
MASKSLPPVKELFQIFQALAGQNEKLSLTRSFHGLSLKQGAAVTRVEDGKIFLKVSNSPAHASADGPICVHHRRLSYLVRGSFHLDNCYTGVGVLSDVNWIQRKWKNRAEDRVEPKSTVTVDIKVQNQGLRAKLDNISTSGMAVLINKSLVPGSSLECGSQVLLGFALSPECKFTTLIGMIVYLQPTGTNLIRLGIKFIPYFEEVACLKAYVSSRKAEILAELEPVYPDSESRSQVTNLYF